MGKTDLPGTVRATNYRDGVTRVYTKLEDDTWQAVYVHRDTGQVLVSRVTFPDAVATRHPRVFVPRKPL